MTATQWLEVLASFSLQVFVVTIAGMILERAVWRPATAAQYGTFAFSVFYSLLVPHCFCLGFIYFNPGRDLTPHELLTVTAVQAVIGKILLAVWSFGATLLLLRWAVRSYLLRRSLCRCTPLLKAQVELLLASIESPVADENLPIILISDELEGPCCRQLHRPTIILPRFLLDGSLEDLRNVLIHEMEHLKTKHPLQLFMQQLAQVVCWFHPAVWNASRHASLAREFSCDDAAAADGADSAAYLRTLLHIAERCERNKHTSTFGFGKSPSEIVMRATRLVKLARERNNGVQRGFLSRNAAACILLLMTFVISQFWLPSDPLASSRSAYSPWPTWTAEVFHCFGYKLRDYEQFDRRTQPYELQQLDMDAHPVKHASLTRATGR